jgi:hypothetical protein
MTDMVICQFVKLLTKFQVTLSIHRLLDINVIKKNVHSTLQQIDPAGNFKKWKEQVTRDVLLLFCMFAFRKDERKLQYSRSIY